MPDRIKQIPAYEQVFQCIITAIKKNEWPVNTKIPSETELAERFGVNRLTVRMALHRLNTMGLLETRTGDGTYITEFNFRNYLEKVTDFYINPDMMNRLMEFRQTIEFTCTKLAIERFTEKEIDELGEIVREIEDLKVKVNASFSNALFLQLVEKDVEFHFKVVSMAHNEFYNYAFEVAREPIHQDVLVLLNKKIKRWMSLRIPPQEWNDLHLQLYDAIKAKDYDRCMQLYKEKYAIQEEFKEDL